MRQKVWHKIISIASWGIISIVLLAIGLVALFYAPWVQEQLTKAAVAKINSSNETTKISVERGRARFPLNLEIDSFAMVENGADTIAAARKVDAHASLLSLIKGKIQANAILDNGRYQIGNSDSTLCLIAKINRLKLNGSRIGLPLKTIELNDVVIDGGSVDLALKTDTTASSPHNPTELRISANKILLKDFDYRMSMQSVIDSLGTHIAKASILGISLDLEKQEISIKDFIAQRIDAAYIAAAPEESQGESTAAQIESEYPSMPWTVTVDSISLSNSSALYAVSLEPSSEGLDFSHIALDSLQLEVSSFYNRGSLTRIPVKQLSARERCGLRLAANGTFSIDSVKMSLDQISVRTPSSAIDFDASMGTGNQSQPPFPLEFVGKGNLAIAEIMQIFPDYGKFLNGIPREESLEFSADLGGSMEDFEIRELTLSLAGYANASITGQLKELSDQSRLSADVSIGCGIGNGGLLSGVLAQSAGSGFEVPQLKIDGRIKLSQGTLHGKIDLRTNSGSLALNGNWESGSRRYHAQTVAEEFPVSAFLPSAGIGALPGTLTLDGQGYDLLSSNTSAEVSAEISRIQYQEQNYEEISALATLLEGKAAIGLKSSDKAATLDIAASCQMAGDSYDWSLEGEAAHIDLMGLGMSQSKSEGSFSLWGKGSFNAHTKGIEGGLKVVDAKWDTEESSFAASEMHAGLSASASATDLLIGNRDLNLSMHIFDPADSAISKLSAAKEIIGRQISLREVNISQLSEALPRFQLKLSSGTGNDVSQYLGQQGISFKELSLKASNDSAITLAGSLAALKTKSVTVDSLALNAFQLQDSLIYRLRAENMKSGNEEYAHSLLEGYLAGNQFAAFLNQQDRANETAFDFGMVCSADTNAIKAEFRPSEPIIASKQWRLNQDNFLAYDFSTHLIDANLKMENDQSAIHLYTDNSDSGLQQKDLIVEISGLELSDWLAVNPFSPPVKGSVSTGVRLRRDGNLLNGNGTISIDDLYYGKSRIGTFNLDLDLYTKEGGLIATSTSLKVNGEKAITLTGIVNDSTSTDSMNLDLGVKALPLEIANPFLADGIAELSGTRNGELKLTGQLTKPLFNGYLNFDSAQVKVLMTGTPLALSDNPVTINDNLLAFQDFNIKGVNDHPLPVNGRVDFQNLASPRMDIGFKASDMQIIGNEKKKSSDIYGKGFIDLDATVKGNLSLLNIDATLGLLPGSNITYKMPEATSKLQSQSNSEMVRFVQFSDTALVEAPDTLVYDKLRLNLDARLKIREGSTLAVELSTDGKNKVQIQGEGSLNYSFSPMEDSRFTGRYTISNGFVRYTPPLMTEKLFNFKDGSYISFNGEMLNPVLNIQAVDQVKANVTQEGQNSRLVDFDVSLSLSNTLENLNIALDLSTDEDITVANELSGMSAEQRANQAMNLLLYNVYTGTSTKGNANISGNALFAFLESKVNSWAANNIKFVDISFGIDQYDRITDGNTSTTTSYSYKVSKSLFNDRFKIAIGGSYSSDTEEDEIAQNLVNDISFEYLLNRSGSMLVKLFRHVGYESILEGEVTQTGVGFVYKRKIRTLADLFKFRRKSPREQSQETSEEDNEETQALPETPEEELR